MTTEPHEHTGYTLEEGHLVLDFINTAYIDLDTAGPFGYQQVDEHMNSLADLGTWGETTGALPDNLIGVLRAVPADAELDRLAEIHRVRESLRQVIRAHVNEEPVPADALELVNTTLLVRLQQTRLVPGEDAFSAIRIPAQTGSVDEAIDHLYWAVGLSTLELLIDEDELALIRECPGDDCGYLFRDSSRGRRRWCSMSSCGNRAKVQRFRDRQKASA
jgi:predicted RNA-binding Zn ribbon-like protein